MATSRRTNGLTLPSIAEVLQARTRETLPDAVRPIATVDAAAGPGALPRACTVLKVILVETHAKRRVMERTMPIHTHPVNGGARSIDRRSSWAERQVRGADDIVTTRIREYHRRHDCPVTDVVREEGTPGL
jgi:hypothetical protein